MLGDFLGLVAAQVVEQAFVVAKKCLLGASDAACAPGKVDATAVVPGLSIPGLDVSIGMRGRYLRARFPCNRTDATIGGQGDGAKFTSPRGAAEEGLVDVGIGIETGGVGRDCRCRG